MSSIESLKTQRSNGEGTTLPEVEEVLTEKGESLPTEAERENLKQAMIRLTHLMGNGGYRYKHVGGTWLEMVARASGIEYTRKHGDMDVVIEDQQAIDFLNQNGFDLTPELETDEGGNKQDFSGPDNESGMLLGVFVNPIEPESSMEITIDGQTMVGDDLMHVYLQKRSNIQTYRSKGLSPRPKDLQDVECAEKILGKEVISQNWSQMLSQEIGRGKENITTLLESGGIEKLRTTIPELPIDDDLKAAALKILDVLPVGSDPETAWQSLKPVNIELQRRRFYDQYGVEITG